MALGGGTFAVANKVLPGSYMNFISLKQADPNISDRGTAALPLTALWGEGGGVITLTNAEFTAEASALFGYDYSAAALAPLRELFKNCTAAHVYRLIPADAAYAVSAAGRGRYKGSRGNDITVAVTVNGADDTKFDVTTYVSNGGVVTEYDTQTAADAAQLADNGFVMFDFGDELEPAVHIFSGGSDGTPVVADYQDFFNKMESRSFNAAAVASADVTVNTFAADKTKLLRDGGFKFQTVLYNTPADSEGVISVKNAVTTEGVAEESLVYWVAGVAAGTAVNRSALNKIYDGEFDIAADYTQAELEQAVTGGEFALHRVGDKLRVLSDINSLVTFTPGKSGVFGENQTVRVIDRISNDIAVLFNTRYLGIVANDKAGRVSLWADIVKLHEQLAEIRAVEDFKDTDIEVFPGAAKKSVVIKETVCPVNAMAQIYMTCVVE